MVRSVLLLLAALVFLVPGAAASDHGAGGFSGSILFAVVVAGGAAFVAVVLAVTAPRPKPHEDATGPNKADYYAGLAVVGAVGLLALAQFLPWGTVAFTDSAAERIYPWGYSSDLGSSGSWFGGDVDGAGHIDLKVAMVLHYLGLLAALPVVIMVWRRPDDTRRTSAVLAGLALVHAAAFFFHMDGAAAAVDDARFGTSWGGWMATAAIGLFATATLLVARLSGLVRPEPMMPALEADVPTQAIPAGAAGGWATNVLDRAAPPAAPAAPRWAGSPPHQPAAAPLPPAPWDAQAPTAPAAPPAPVPSPSPAALAAPADAASDLVRLRCPKCQAMVEAVRGVRPICPGCGFGRP